jgi:hypothetical protein
MKIFMSRRQMASWERLRRHGRFRFVLLYGVILFGGLSTVVLMASRWFSGGYEYFEMTFLSRPLTVVLAGVLGGVAFGFLVWEFNEIRYRHALEDDRAAE